jgi:tetratricopeptide (TPR) repeat protein
MKKLLAELRRREVFRTVGLYIGGVWIVLQVADVVLPAYDTPLWVYQALIGVALAGLPVAIALAWMFDVTDEGIERDTETPGAGPIAGGRKKGDLVVVGVLLLALSVSLFVNFRPREAVVAAPLDPVSILIADFDNKTGDNVFNGALEQALSIAIEESPFITAYDRTSASRILESIDGRSTLDPAGARIVSAREGIGLVVTGTLAQEKRDYRVDIAIVDVESGEELARFSDSAEGKSSVLGLVGEQARDLREELGDVNADRTADGVETFTTASIEAMRDYVDAQRLARDGLDDEAIGLYQSAVAKDPAFGRAWSGLAVSADKLGRADISAQAWQNALGLLDTMTERERYRTEGVYYSLVAGNSQKAIETYVTLVEKFPADDAGYNNLAVAYFLDLQFDKALEAGRKVVKIYPTRPMYHANYSLYAMYASDFDAALEEAEKTLELNPNYHKAFLPSAVSALVKGDTAAARAAYDQMAQTGTRGASLANIGIADMLLWSGDAAGADAVLVEGIAQDQANNNTRALATKTMMRAYALHQQGSDKESVGALVAEALALAPRVSIRVPAALLYLALGMEQEAAAIAAEFAGQLDVQQRAYAKLLDALRLEAGGDNIAAIESLRQAVALADLWLARFYLGQTYFKAGYYAEAASEFASCKERLGEGYSLFLDDTPTYRYTAGLDDQLVQARTKLTQQL